MTISVVLNKQTSTLPFWYSIIVKMPRGTGRLDKIRQTLSTLTVEELQQIRRSQSQQIPAVGRIEEESDSDVLVDDVGPQSPPRFVHWASCLMFSIITMTSAIIISKGNSLLTNQTASSETWGIALPAVTLALSGIAVLMYLFPVSRGFIENKKLEGFLIIVMSLFWAAAVYIISDPKDGIAVDSNGAVTNGNVYYFAWAGFVSSVTLLISYLRSAFNVDVVGEIQSRSARLNLWSALLPTSIVVMASSANIFANQCTGASHPASNMYCMRTLYGVTLGSCSSFIALLIVIIKMALSRVPFLVEAVSSFLLVPYFVFGVAIITYHNGPGSSIGNLYYFTWLSFIASFMLAASCLEERYRSKALSLSNELRRTNPRMETTGHEIS